MPHTVHNFVESNHKSWTFLLPTSIFSSMGFRPSMVTSSRRFQTSTPAQRSLSIRQLSSVEVEDVDLVPIIVDDIPHMFSGGVKKKLQIHSIHIIIIACLWFSIFETYPCRYRSTANRMRNRLRWCRHAVSGFLQLPSGVQRREDCAVIHQPAPTAQIAR